MGMPEAIQIVERYDRAVKKMEDDAIERMNKAIALSFDALDRKLSKDWNSLESLLDGEMFTAKRELRLKTELGALLRIIDPTKEDFEGLYDELITNASETGAELGNRLIRAISEDEVRAFGDVQLEAAAVAARDSYNRLQKYSQDFADNTSILISDTLLRGLSYKAIERELVRRTELTQYQAARIARTEVISALSESSQDRYLDADIEYIQLVPVGDDRTCPTCSYRTGFVYKIGKLRHPLHPFCRCYIMPWSNEWEESGLQDSAFMNQYRDKALTELEATGAKPNTGVSPFERAAGMTSPPAPDWTPADIKPRPAPVSTSGSANKSAPIPKPKRQPKLKTEVNFDIDMSDDNQLVKLGQDFTAPYTKRLNPTAKELQLKGRYDRLANELVRISSDGGFPSDEQIATYHVAEQAYWAEVDKRKAKSKAAYEDIRKSIIKHNGINKATAQQLAKGTTIQKTIPITYRVPVKNYLEEFYQLTGGRSATSIYEIGFDKRRAYASAARGYINTGDEFDKTTFFHEAAHHIEFEDRQVMAAAVKWRLKKAISEDLKPLKQLTGIDYDDSEVALEDKYINAYVGKVYGGDPRNASPTEVISMGVEHFTDAENMRQLRERDEEHFNFIVGLLVGRKK